MADAEGTLWPLELLARARVRDVPGLSRVVVAVDPAVSSGAKSDLCGIVVAGVWPEGPPADWRAYVLEDASLRASSPTAWAQAAIDAARRHGADRIVAEVNQGGNLVGEVLRGGQVDPLVPTVPFTPRGARRCGRSLWRLCMSKAGCSMPRPCANLEDQMGLMTAQGFTGTGSPDRVDALVWALHEVMLAPAARWSQPKLRTLG